MNFKAPVPAQRYLASHPDQNKLLEALTRHAPSVLPRAFLMSEVWNTECTGDTRTLAIHMRWLREKIEAGPHVRAS